jgi:hypothetical protein
MSIHFNFYVFLIVFNNCLGFLATKRLLVNFQRSADMLRLSVAVERTYTHTHMHTHKYTHTHTHTHTHTLKHTHT